FSFSDSRWLTLDEIKSDSEIKNSNALGFHIPGMWDKILDIDKCYLQEDPSNAIRDKVKAFATENNFEFYNARNQHG
ncbi:23S rRNA (uracil-5-)-methyltransferase RumA, partial [Aquimarina celericrescens]|nr:23S rRNA (uracil-5-)-methyltransferase RumA [Aquimarina celericrescens]